MASYAETTSVSIRKGNTSENQAFTGILGEVTFDSGIDGTGTDINTTLRIHNGINSGGISIARADLANTTTKAFAEKRGLYGDKNLAYADLSNFEKLTDSTAIELIVNTLSEYGLETIEDVDYKLLDKANKNMSNINTVNLATVGAGHEGDNLAYANLANLEHLDSTTQSTEINTILTTLTDYGLANKNMANVDTADLATTGHGHTGKNLAYFDMSNVNTSSLASGENTSGRHQGKDLAYKDTSNINTANLVNTNIHTGDSVTGKPLAYADMANVDTADLATTGQGHTGKNLAYVDMTNMADADVKTKLRRSTINVEFQENKKTDFNNIDTSDITYPTRQAVKTYITNEIESLIDNYATINFDNVIDWNRLYEKSAVNTVKYDNSSDNITTVGTQFTLIVNPNEVPTIAPTSYTLTDLVSLKLAIYTTGIDSQDETADRPVIPTSYRVYPEYGKTNISATTITFKNNYGSTAQGTLYCKPHTGLSGVYCYFVTIDKNNVKGPDGTHVTSYGWEASQDFSNLENTPLYDNIDNIQVQPILCVQPTIVNSNGNITAFNYLPAEGASIPQSQITIAHPMIMNTSTSTPTFSIQSGNNATVTLKTIIENAGAGVLKCNLENLPGITGYDKVCNTNTEWTINKKDAVPATTEASISDREYNRLATIGQVWECAKQINSKIIFRQWS